MSDINRRLRELSDKRLLPGSHQDYLFNLKHVNNISPLVIYDIGACVLFWTNEAKEIWPDAKYYCFEAMPEVEFLFKEANLEGYHLGVLSDINGKEVEFYQNTEYPGGNSYYKENIQFNKSVEMFFNDSHKRKYVTKTLDTIVSENNFLLPDMIKIDVQGAELDILKGSEKCLSVCKHLILELQKVEYNIGAPLKDTVIEFVESKGFKLVNNMPFSDNGPDGDYHFIKI